MLTTYLTGLILFAQLGVWWADYWFRYMPEQYAARVLFAILGALCWSVPWVISVPFLVTIKYFTSS